METAHQSRCGLPQIGTSSDCQVTFDKIIIFIFVALLKGVLNMNYWLFKTEPENFSIEDLKKSKNQTTFWDGVRNYIARNILRDEIKKGDGVLFYHSSTEPLAVMGYCEVVKEGYPDHTQFEKNNIYFDEKAKKENPTWFMVDIKLVKEFNTPVTLDQVRANPKLKNITLLRRGNRLSVMPVTQIEFEEILKMGN